MNSSIVIYLRCVMDAEIFFYQCLLINDEIDFGNKFKDSLYDVDNIKVTVVSNYKTAKELILRNNFNFIAVNLSMNELSISNLCHDIKEVGHIPILLILPSVEYLFVKRYLVNGNAWGFCILNDTTNEVKEAVDYLRKGKRYISRGMMELLVDDLLSTHTPKRGSEIDPKRVELLDEKEFEIFTHLSRNITDDVIAQIMDMHPSAVGLYRERIFEKLRIKEIKSLRQLILS